MQAVEMVTAPLTTDQERSHGASWHNDTRKEQSRCYGYVEHDHLKALTKAASMYGGIT